MLCKKDGLSIIMQYALLSYKYAILRTSTRDIVVDVKFYQINLYIF